MSEQQASSRSVRWNTILAEYQQAVEAGKAPDAEKLIEQNPEFADALREYLVTTQFEVTALPTIPPTLDMTPASESPALPPAPSSSEADTITIAPSADESSPASAKTLPAGGKVGHFGDYELLEEIARGGMGVVYKARQVNLNRTVALKMILAGQLASEEDVKRFYTEAESAANLAHPGIVPIFEVGQYEGQHYFSMGFVGGESLAHKVVDGPLPPEQAAELTMQVAEAIAFANEQGVIHRDLKPANILLDEDGQPKVTDFGLAKRMEDDSDLTGTGQILGTPSYMAPEQAAGKTDEIGPLADVYALGAILYCLLTGRPPFQAATPLDTMLQVLDKEPISPRQLNPNLPRDLETICLKCLEKEPSRRYASAAELSEELRRYVNGKPIKARPISAPARAWRWCKRNPVVASLTTAVAVALVGGTAISGYFAILANSRAEIAIEEQGRADKNAEKFRLEKERADDKAAEALAEKQKAEAALQEKERAETEKQRAETEKQRAEVENNRKRAATLVDALLTAPAEGVPYVIQSLQPFKEQSLPVLRGQFENTTLYEVQRLHVALALAAFGQVEQDFLVASVAAASGKEAGNLLTALRPFQDTAISSLQERFQNERKPHVKIRLAIALLHLGQADVAQSMLALAPGPAERTALIHGLDQWHASLTDYIPSLQNSEDSAFRSGLCLALGRIPSDALPFATRQKLVPVLLDLYQNASDGPTHSASGWALRQWQVELPEIKPTPKSGQENGWYLNKLGMTMLRIPAGSFARRQRGFTRNQAVTLTRPFYLCDQEVTVEQFERFLKDADYQEGEKRQNQTVRNRIFRPTKDCPAGDVTWFDALMFCNWLSQREGHSLCYQRTGETQTEKIGETTFEWDVYRWESDGNGYRLPSEAEWEFACRAGTSTNYCSGNDVVLMGDYGWWAENSNTRNWPVASKLPNGWGLFDMHGNAMEWCWDWFGPYAEASVSDPVGPNRGKYRAQRGGASGLNAQSVRSAERHAHPPGSAGARTGFRVARTHP